MRGPGFSGVPPTHHDVSCKYELYTLCHDVRPRLQLSPVGISLHARPWYIATSRIKCKSQRGEEKSLALPDPSHFQKCPSRQRPQPSRPCAGCKVPIANDVLGAGQARCFKVRFPSNSAAMKWRPKVSSVLVHMTMQNQPFVPDCEYLGLHTT